MENRKKIKLDSMKWDSYTALHNFGESYKKLAEAMLDELYQNYFDKCLPHFYASEGKNHLITKHLSQLRVILDDHNNTLIFEETGTTGIEDREEYITFAKIAKSKNDTGSRGQGWKLIIPHCKNIIAETQVKGKYYQCYVSVDHTKQDIGIKWLDQDEFFERELGPEMSTRIKITGIDEQHFQKMKKIAEEVLITRWFRKLQMFQDSIRIFIAIEEKEKEISLPIFPSPTDEVSHFEKSNFTYLGARNTKIKVENLKIYHTYDHLPFGINKGIAIVSMGHTVSWIEFPETSNIEGYIVGYVASTDENLKDAEDTTHQGFRDVKAYTNLQNELKGYINQIVDEVYQLENEYKTTKLDLENVDLMTEINSILSEMVPALVDDYGLHGVGGTGFGTQGDKIKIVDSFDLIHSESNNEAIISARLLSEKSFKGSIKLLVSTKNDATLLIGEDIDLKSNQEKLYDYIYKINGLSDKVKETVEFKLSIHTTNGSEIEKKTKKIFLNQLIKHIYLNQPSYEIGSKAKVIVNFDEKIKKMSKDSILYLEANSLDTKTKIGIGKKELHEIKSENPTFTFDLAQKMKFNSGKYQLRAYIKSSNQICDEKSKIFMIDRWIIGKTIVGGHIRRNFDNQIEVRIFSICQREKSLKIEIELKDKGSKSIIKSAKTVAKPLNYQNLKFQLKTDNSFIRGRATFWIRVYDAVGKIIDHRQYTVQIDKDKAGGGGFLSRIRGSDNSEEEKIAYIDTEGSVVVNTRNYLFRKLDREEGISSKEFLKGLIVIIYYAMKDKGIIPEGVDWYDFEEKLGDRL